MNLFVLMMIPFCLVGCNQFAESSSGVSSGVSSGFAHVSGSNLNVFAFEKSDENLLLAKQIPKLLSYTKSDSYSLRYVNRGFKEIYLDELDLESDVAYIVFLLIQDGRIVMEPARNIPSSGSR